MPTIDDLNARFRIPTIARFEAGRGGLTRLAVTGPVADGHVYLHGAHVAHYQPHGSGPVLFLSGKSFFEAGKAVRGGVPVIFPWFGQRQDGEGPMHGLVRTMEWAVERVEQVGENVVAALSIASDEQTRAAWPHDFALRFEVTFARSLEMKLHVRNTGSSEFRFEEALHTYFALGDVRAAPISGLAGATYFDKNQGLERRVDEAGVLQLTGPTDRVYAATTAACAIDDKVNRRRITVAKQNSNSTVVWNPWSDKITSFADLDAQEWPGFVCIETCNVRDDAITLAPGASHTMGATITLG